MWTRLRWEGTGQLHRGECFDVNASRALSTVDAWTHAALVNLSPPLAAGRGEYVGVERKGGSQPIDYAPASTTDGLRDGMAPGNRVDWQPSTWVA